MKIDFSAHIKTITGETFDDPVTKKPMTLGQVCAEALMANDETAKTGIEKFKRYELAKKTHKSEVTDISAENISFIKECVGKAMTTHCVGACYELLESPVSDEKKDEN